MTTVTKMENIARTAAVLVIEGGHWPKKNTTQGIKFDRGE